MKLSMKTAALCFLATVLLVSQCSADFWGDVLKGRTPKGGDVAWEIAQQLIQRKPRITSSIADAATDMSVLDGFTPIGAQQLSKLPVGSGGYVLDQPGFFSMNANAFSVSPGLNQPDPSMGYVYAPLHGPCSGVVRKIVKKYGGDPHEGQQRIQRLLWGISSLSNLGDLAPDLQSTAYDCLSKEECKLVDSTGLGDIYNLVKSLSSLKTGQVDFFDPSSKVVEKLSEQARSVLEAQWKLRKTLEDAGATYSEIESEAFGHEQLEREKASRDIPAGRWSYHPNGYFVRYQPDSYSSVKVQVSLPPACTVERDSLGRITKIADDSGNRIIMAYEDQAEVAGDGSGVKAYEFAKVTFVRPLSVTPDLQVTQEITSDGTGFALVGMPSKKKCDKWSPGEIKGLADRYHLAWEAASDIEGTLKGAAGLRPSGRQTTPSGTEQELVDLASCIQGLTSVIGESPVKGTWAADHLSLAYEAWEDSFCKLAGDRNSKPEFDPTDGVAVPGDGASQCLMVSSVAASSPYMQTGQIPDSFLQQLPPETLKQIQEMQRQAQQQMEEMAQTDPAERDSNCRMVTLHLQLLKAIRQALADNPPARGEDSTAYIARMETMIKESQGLGDCKLSSPSTVIPPGLGYGMPEIVLTAAKAHAKSHEETVPKQESALAKWLKNANNYQQAEMAALGEQIKVLDNWCMMNGCSSVLQEGQPVQ